MKAFFPAPSITDENTVTITLTVEDVLKLNKIRTREKLPTNVAHIVACATEYIESRKKHEHCFVTQGNPWDERTATGESVGEKIKHDAGLECGTIDKLLAHNALIYEKGNPVGCIIQEDEKVGLNAGRWRVYPLDDNGNRTEKPYGYVESNGAAWTVHNPRMPDVERPNLETAVLTCFMRGHP